jgi:hypothetical protein
VGRKLGGTKFGPGSRARKTFLEELATTGRIYDSCKVAGVCYQTMQKFRDERTDLFDPAFVDEFEEAMAAYSDILRKEVHRRAVDGWVERGVYDKDGTHLGDVVRYSDRLLELSIKRHDPAWRENLKIEAEATVQASVVSLLGDLREMTDEELSALEILNAGAQRRKELQNGSSAGTSLLPSSTGNVATQVGKKQESE